MREYSTPQTVTVPTTGNLTDDVVRNAAEVSKGTVLVTRFHDGQVESVARDPVQPELF